MKFLRFIISGEFLFAAFLLANVYKSALPETPVDLNIILFILTIAVAVKRLIFFPEVTKKAVFPVSLFLVFLAVALFSYLYSPSEIYALEKLSLLFTLSLWTFAAPFLLITNRQSLGRFLNSFLLIAILIATYVLITYEPSNSGGIGSRIGVDGANTVGLGRTAAMGVVIITMLFLFNKNMSKFKRVFSLAMMVVLLIVLFLTGARMALLSLVAVLLAFVVFKAFKVENDKVYINKKSIKVASSMLVVPLLLLPFYESLEFMLTRLTYMFNESGVGSYSQRTELYTIALQMWNGNFFVGDGIGSYTISFDGVDERYYPHNIVLEVASELGLVGLAIFIVWLIAPFVMSNQIKSNHLQITVLLIFIYTFLNTNTTGDLNDNRLMFAFLALMYMHPLYQENEKKTELDRLKTSQ